ncbi:MAG: tRNA (adenosine(37)-N6)-threonylcarbamoyltransferase complex dimerization subunit type 1 TsaB [Clostridia bacterium]|nr:tRNA (adenosine(37)-N6)-threonylcarbamoyltransferase complex dimerization subunit type 1 TsaB [Clostridia bacterium]
MKNFLAVDTSGSYLTVLAVKDGNAFSCYLPECAMKQSVLLMNAVDETLQKANMTLGDCDFFAAVVGAGSFTGIRIGISAVKGFCAATGKPALPITSFDVAAYNTIDSEDVGEKSVAPKTLCLVDALHDCYYACGYQQGKVCYPPAYLEEAEVLALVKEGYTAVSTSPLPLSQKTAVQIVDPVTGLKNAVEGLAKDENNFGALTALYVRKSSAELNLSNKG